MGDGGSLNVPGVTFGANAILCILEASRGGAHASSTTGGESVTESRQTRCNQ